MVFNLIPILDIIFFLIFVRISWSAFSHGFGPEIFKIIGVSLAGLISFHFYPWLKVNLPNREGFSVLFISSAAIFFALAWISERGPASRSFSEMERLIAVIVSWIRFSLLVGIICFGLWLNSSSASLSQNSYIAKAFKQLAVIGYFRAVDFANKLYPDLKPNLEVEKYYEAEKVI